MHWLSLPCRLMKNWQTKAEPRKHSSSLLTASYLLPPHSTPAPESLDSVTPVCEHPSARQKTPKAKFKTLLMPATLPNCFSNWPLNQPHSPTSLPDFWNPEHPHFQPQLPGLQPTYKQALACCPRHLQDFLPLSISSHSSAIQPLETKPCDPPPHSLSWTPTTFLNSFRVRMYPRESTTQPSEFC